MTPHPDRDRAPSHRGIDASTVAAAPDDARGGLWSEQEPGRDAVPMRAAAPTAGASSAGGVPWVTSPRRWARPARIAVGVATAAAGLRFVGLVVANVQTTRAIDADPRGAAAPLAELRVPQQTFDRLRDLTQIANVGSGVFYLAMLVAAVFVIRWQTVPIHNQRALGVAAPRYSPRAAGWSWFVPVWAFFGPKRAYDDAWRAAAGRPGTADHAEGSPGRSTPRLFPIWWAAWIVANLLDTASRGVGGALLGDRRATTSVGALSSLSMVVAGVLFLAVIERMTVRHEAVASGPGGR